MSEVADLIADMVRAGVDPDLIGRTAAALAGREPVVLSDEAAERRRAKDRERKRLRKSAEICGNSSALSSPEVSPQTPLPNPSNPKPPSPPKGGSSPKRAERLPADWRLPDDWRQDAVDAGLAPQRIDIEAATMLDWSRSAPGGAKLDWRATWRNWCRRASDRPPQPIARGSPKPPTAQEILRSRRESFNHDEPAPNGPYLIAAR